jgi:hypothetical protein
MTHPVNTIYASRFLHLDSAGDPVTGLTQSSYSTRVATLTDDDGTILSTATISIVEQSGGHYGYFFTPDTVGDWDLSVVYSAVTPARRWSATVQVITAAQADPAASITSGANAEAVAAVIMAEPVGGASGTIGAALARLVSGAVTTIPTGEALSADNTLTLEVNGSYLTADGDARDFLDTDWTVHSLTDVGVSVFFVALAGSLVLRQDMTVVNATTVRLELTGAQTYQMRNASAYKVWAELPGVVDPVLLVGGPLAMQG